MALICLAPFSKPGETVVLNPTEATTGLHNLPSAPNSKSNFQQYPPERLTLFEFQAGRPLYFGLAISPLYLQMQEVVSTGI